MPDYPHPWPSEAVRERAHIRTIFACVREHRDLPAADLLRKLAEVHLEFARPDMAEEREQEIRSGIPPRDEVSDEPDTAR